MLFMDSASSTDSDHSQSSNIQVDGVIEPNGPCSTPPTSLEAPISPPPIRSAKRRRTSGTRISSPPDLAAIEAGEVAVDDHLSLFSNQLSRCIRSGKSELFSIDDFKRLYQRNQHPHGRHFVVHQHDHPVAGRSLNLIRVTLFLSNLTTHSLHYLLILVRGTRNSAKGKQRAPRQL